MPEVELYDEPPFEPEDPQDEREHAERPSARPARWTPVATLVDEAVEEMYLRNEYPDLGGLSTGIPCLDEKLKDALVPGSLIVVAGESGGSKTALCVQLALAFAHQRPVMSMTFEDQGRDAVKRALANHARENVGDLRRGYAGQVGLPAAVLSSAKVVSDLGWDWVEDALGVEGIGRTVWEWQQERGTDEGVVLIDQLSHILPPSLSNPEYWEARALPIPPKPSAPDHQVYEWQCHILKKVAERLNLVIILACQLNENHGKGKPTQASIRGSRGIVHKASAVLCPWIPKEIPNPFPGEGQPATMPNTAGVAHLIAVKARLVPAFDVELRWNGAEQRFEDPAVSSPTYVPPPPPTARALEGKAKLAELRESWALRRSESGQPELSA